MLVALLVFQLLMSLLKLVPQLLKILPDEYWPKRKPMSVTRDTCSTRPEQGVRARGVALDTDEGVAESIKSGCICGSLHPRC